MWHIKKNILTLTASYTVKKKFYFSLKATLENCLKTKRPGQPVNKLHFHIFDFY